MEIVDLRGNLGGSDGLAAAMCGFFYAAPAFYEYQEYYDKRTGHRQKLTELLVTEVSMGDRREAYTPKAPKAKAPEAAAEGKKA